MLQNILHWVAIATQVINVATPLVPDKYKVWVAGAIGLGQYFIHLFDPNAPSIGATNGGPGPKV